MCRGYYTEARKYEFYVRVARYCSNLELAMLDSRVEVKLASRDCALVDFRRSRL